MARRRVKKRTHVGARNGAPNGGGNPLDRSPKSMVIRIGAGEVGASVSQLVKDMRHVMEPGTASRLKVSFPKKPYSHLYLLCFY
jgi:ribosome biogenesis protein SSF1/2